MSLLRALFRKPVTFTRKPMGFRPTLELLEHRLAPATFAVVNTNDSGAGSLRQAIVDANATAAADTITFSAALNNQTILMGGTQMTITQPLTITGPGAAFLKIDANNGSRVFNVDDGNPGASIAVSITGLTLQRGSPTGANFGGAIVNKESLTIRNSTISANFAGGDGAGIYSTGALTIINSTITNNSTNGSGNGGGGLYNSGAVTITSSFFSGNSATHGAGGIQNDGTLTISNSTVAGNSNGPFGGGGGIGNRGTATISNSTLSVNTAVTHGGGVFNAGILTVTNSTIVLNRAANGGGSGTGGGVHTSTGATTKLFNTIVAGNTRGAGNGTADDLNGASAVDAASGSNLIGDPATAGGLTQGVKGNILGNGAGVLLPLANILNPVLTNNNGGPTMTHALIASSPALNAGSNTFAVGLTSDQRGAPFVRVAGGKVDIGAFERQTAVLPALIVSTTLDESDGNYAAGDLSLREAIGLANGSVGANSITFAAALAGKAITLKLGELSITDAVSIAGPGAGSLAIDGNNTSRIFLIDDGGAGEIAVSISGLTLRNGTAGSGGAILSREVLTIANSTLSANSSTDNGGGGLYNQGAATINNSTFSANVTTNQGGGLFNAVDADLTITNSTFSANVAQGNGGGLFNAADADLTITNSIFSANVAQGNGGGIYNQGIATITGSMFSANRVPRSNGIPTTNDGGGICNNTGTAVVASSTFWANAAGIRGGGIANLAGAVTVTNSTFLGNNANIGGGLYNAAAVSVANSTFSGNSAMQGAGIAIFSGAATIANSIISANSAISDGGGLFNKGNTTLTSTTFTSNSAMMGAGICSAAAITIGSSTFAANVASTLGGGLYTTGPASITNSTFSANSAVGIAPGGAIYNGANATITNSTIVLNRANTDGGGIETGGGIFTHAAGSTTLRNSIVAGNLQGAGAGTADDCNGPRSLEAASSNNLIGDPATAGGLTNGVNFNLIGASLASVLDPVLRNNGGPTQTHALIPGSPAIDAGDNANIGVAFITDQRGTGFPRIVGTQVDIGAYEMPRTLFIDKFERADNATVGAPWVARAGALGIAGNLAQGTGVSTVHLATIGGATAADVELYASVNLQNNQSAGLVARYKGLGDQNYYVGALQRDAAGATFAKIIKNVNGVRTELAVVEGVGSTGKLRFRALGTELQLFLDGTLLATVRDATFRTGEFGVRTIGATALDVFEARPLSIGLDHFDSFTRPEDTTLVAPWARVAGSYTHQGNQSKGLDALNLAIIDGAAQADVDVRATVAVTGLNQQAGLVARLQNGSNFYLAQLTRTATGLSAQLIKFVAGVPTPLKTIAISTSSGRAMLRFTAVGDNLKVYVNSARVIDVQDAQFAAGAVGIRSDAYATFDDFRVLTVTTSLPFADAFNQGELGISWVRRAGNFKIIGDHAAGTLASPNINLTTLASVNAPNIAVQADIHLSRIGDEVGLVANFTNASNYYVGRVVKTSTGHALSIQKIVGGVTTTLGAVSNVAGALTGSIKFQVLGPTLKLFMNGVEQLSRTDLALSRGTAGIRSKGTGGIDNVSVSDPAIVPFADTFGVSALDPRWVTRTGGFTTTGAETAKGTAATNLMTLGRLDAADVDVQAVINLSNLTGEFASLVARHTGAGDLNMYLATIAYNGTQFVASIQKRVNGVTTTLASVNLGVGEGTLRFTVVGGKLTLFFDGTQVLSVYDFTFKTGSAGLRSSLTPTFDELFVNPTA